MGQGTVANKLDIRFQVYKVTLKFEKLHTWTKKSFRSNAGQNFDFFDLSGPLAMLVHLKMTRQFIFEDKALRAKTFKASIGC